MKNFGGKKRLTINLKLFSSLSHSFPNPNSTKSSMNFHDGVVRLAIIAAMTDSTLTHQAICFAPSPRSTPIPIDPSAKAAPSFGGGLNSENFYELSDNYTCVISNFGHNLIKKHAYIGDDKKNCSVFTASSLPRKNSMGQFRREFSSDEFLTCCHLCEKVLHGLDVFMYRGEKAFCSAECRDKQITSDDQQEIRGAEVGKGKPLRPL